MLPPWASLATWVGLVIAVLISMWKGWLTPKSQVDKYLALMEKRLAERVADMESRINDRDAIIVELRAANAALDARNDLLSDQVRQLVGVGQTTAAAITAQVIEVGDGGSTAGGFSSGDSSRQDPKNPSRTQIGVNKETSRRGSRRR